MKIIIEDFKYEGKYIGKVEFEMPQLSNIEDIPEDKIVPYVMGELKDLLKEN